jgi:hypothetical protein
MLEKETKGLVEMLVIEQMGIGRCSKDHAGFECWGAFGVLVLEESESFWVLEGVHGE